MTETKGKSGIFYGWWIVFVCFFIYGFSSVINFTMTIYAPFIAKEMNWTRGDIGNINTAYLFIMLVFAVAAGWFIDKYGPKLCILIGAAMGTLGMVLFSTMQSRTEAYIYFGGLIGIGVVMQMGLPTKVLARRWFLKKAGLATGVLTSSTGFISSIFFPLFAKMSEAYGWRSMVLWSGTILEVIIFFLVLFLIKDSPESVGLHMDGMSDEETKIVQGAVGKMLEEEPHMTRGEALKSPQLWIVIISLTFFSLVMTGFLYNVPLIGLSVGMTAAQAALVMSAWVFSAIIGKLGGGWVADKLGKRKALMLIGFLNTVGYTYAWLFASSPTPLYIFAIWAGIVMSPILVIMVPFYGDLFGRLHLASILGFAGLIPGLISALGPLVAGRIAEATNSYQLLYLLGAVASLVLVILIPFVKPTRVELEMSKPKAASGA